MASPLRIVFFGTPEFAAYALKKTLSAGYQIVAVVTAPDKPAGRGQQVQESAVKKTAMEHNLPVLQPSNLKSPEFQQQLASLNADLGIVIAFRMLPQAVWSMPRLGTFNLHASLLPQYRGAAPINHAIINGETETGVTTFFLKHDIDTGDIVLQQKVAIEPDENAGSLHDKLMIAGAQLVIDTLKLVEQGNWPVTPQNMETVLKPAPKIHPDFCLITNNLSPRDAYNKIRGLSPYPGAWLPDGSMKVYASALVDEQDTADRNLGLEIDFSAKKLFWNLESGRIELTEVQPKGKKRMSAREYLNGQANILKN